MLIAILRKYGGVIFYVLLAVFFIMYIRSLDLSKLDINTINPGYLILSGAAALGFRFWGAYIWVIILRGLGAKNLRLSWPLLFVYAKSWMARYIPGTAPWILSKIYFASKHGISKNKLAVSSLLEAALQIVSLLAFSLFILAIDTHTIKINDTTKILLWICLAGLIILLYPRIFNFFISIAYRITKRKSFSREHYVNNKTVIKGIVLYLIGSVINGVGMFFIAKAVYEPLAYDQLLFVIGAGSLAGSLGMLAIFAPSGIGVRDGIQLALLSLIIPQEYALIVVIATRIWDVVIDVVFYCFSLIFNREGKFHDDKNQA